MLKRIRKTLAVVVATLALAAVPLAVAAPAAVFAQESEVNISDGLKCGSNLDAQALGTCDANVDAGSEGINDIITDIINIFSIIVGIVSVMMIIYGGFRYVASGGDSGKVGDAKNTIIYAIIGLVIVALAQFIVQFVLDKVTEV